MKQKPEAVPFYDALAADYDRFVNWPARLAHELPFLEERFQAAGVGRILDTACGTGQHTIALAQRGYEAVGTDPSEGMIHRARSNAAAVGVAVDFYLASLGQHRSLGMTFDAVLCLGNSLPHLLSASAVEQALADLAAVLRPGGLLIIQNRNFDRVWAARERFMEPQSYLEQGQEWIFVRFYDFLPESLVFHMLRLRRLDEGWRQDVESTELRPIFRQDLAQQLSAAAFHPAEFYGGYDGSWFDPEQSGDLLTVAWRASRG